jgi:hypothetical protein
MVLFVQWTWMRQLRREERHVWSSPGQPYRVGDRDDYEHEQGQERKKDLMILLIVQSAVSDLSQYFGAN